MIESIIKPVILLQFLLYYDHSPCPIFSTLLVSLTKFSSSSASILSLNSNCTDCFAIASAQLEANLSRSFSWQELQLKPFFLKHRYNNEKYFKILQHGTINHKSGQSHLSSFLATIPPSPKVSTTPLTLLL